MGGAYRGLPGPTGDGRALQRPIDDGRALQRTSGRTRLTKDSRARQSTTRTAVFLRLGRFPLASLPTLPGTDGSIRRPGPAIRTGRLGTLVADIAEHRKIGKMRAHDFLPTILGTYLGIFCSLSL